VEMIFSTATTWKWLPASKRCRFFRQHADCSRPLKRWLIAFRPAWHRSPLGDNFHVRGPFGFALLVLIKPGTGRD